MPSDFSHFQPGNPFLPDLASEGPGSGGESALLHPGALGDLEEMLALARNQPPSAAGGGGGQVVLLRAPRAGFGKSHLLSQLRDRTEAEAFVAPVSFDPEGGVGWRSALHQVLAHWHLPAAGGGLTTIDLIARRVFSLMNADLIRTGKVPCAHPARTLAVLDRDFAVMFDFTDSGQPVAQWFQDHFEALLAASLPYLRGLTDLPEASLRTWLRALCGYCQEGTGSGAQRLESLHWALRQPSSPASGGGGAAQGGMQFFSAVTEGENFYRGMLTALCRLAAAGRPLVVMLDHFDGFYNSPDDLLRLGRLITDWRRLSGRTVLVLSVNEDLWTGAFQKSLPSALEDRLTGWEVSLGGISLEEAAALVRARLESARVPPAVARGFAAGLDLQGLAGHQPAEAGLLSPRTVLRYAAHRWREYWKPAAGVPAAPAPRAGGPEPLAEGPAPSAGGPELFPALPRRTPEPPPSGPPLFPSAPSAPALWPPAPEPVPPPSAAPWSYQNPALPPEFPPAPAFQSASPPGPLPPSAAPDGHWPDSGPGPRAYHASSMPGPPPPARDFPAARFPGESAFHGESAFPAADPYPPPAPSPPPSYPFPAAAPSLSSSPSPFHPSVPPPSPPSLFHPPAPPLTPARSEPYPPVLQQPSSQPPFYPPVPPPPSSPSLFHPSAPPLTSSRSDLYPPSPPVPASGARPPYPYWPPPEPASPFPAPAPFPAASPAPASPPAPAPPEHTLAGRFQRLRSYFAAAAPAGPDHARLHRLIRWSGQRLAVVRYGEAPLPGRVGWKTAVWQSPDAEILFGTEPFSDHAYWAALLEFARQRHQQVPGCRVVMFSAASAPVNPAAWLHPEEIPAARGRFLDVQTLSHSELAILHAAAEVLGEAERGVLTIGSSDAFAAMAPQLEFFWKRLTRPFHPPG